MPNPQSHPQFQSKEFHYEQTPTLLLLSLPRGALAGIDLLSFTTSSPRFRGISTLPVQPALHFAFAAANSGFAGRWGVWFSTSGHAVAGSSSISPSSTVSPSTSTSLTVLKWDHAEESLVAEADVAELLRWRANLGTLVREGGLIGYTQQRKGGGSEGERSGRVVEIDGDGDGDGGFENRDGGKEEIVGWAALTSFVTPEVLDRILGNGSGDADADGSGAGTGAVDGGQKTWRLSSMSSSLSDRDEVPGLQQPRATSKSKPISGDTRTPSHGNQEDPKDLHNPQASSHPPLSPERTRLADRDDDDKPLNLLPINLTQTWAPGTTGRARTTAALDRSWAWQSLLSTHCSSNPLQILGELQFTFVMLLTLNNVSCAEQWLRLLRLLLTCVDAVRENPGVWVKVLETLGSQLRFVGASADAEVFALLDLVDETSEVKVLLGRFRRGLESLISSTTSTTTNTTASMDAGFGAATGSGREEKADVNSLREAEEGILEVRKELDKLEAFLTAERGWQFGGVFAKQGMLVLEDGEEVRMETTAFDEDDEEGEFAPVMVELTDEQAKFMGIERGDEAGDTVATLKKGRLKLEQEILMQQKLEEAGIDDEEETEDEDSHHDGRESSDEDEDMGDLEDMDARF